MSSWFSRVCRLNMFQKRDFVKISREPEFLTKSIGWIVGDFRRGISMQIKLSVWLINWCWHTFETPVACFWKAPVALFADESLATSVRNDVAWKNIDVGLWKFNSQIAVGRSFGRSLGSFLLNSFCRSCYTPENYRLEPKNHPIEKEHHLPSTSMTLGSSQ